MIILPTAYPTAWGWRTNDAPDSTIQHHGGCQEVFPVALAPHDTPTNYTPLDQDESERADTLINRGAMVRWLYDLGQPEENWDGFNQGYCSADGTQFSYDFQPTDYTVPFANAKRSFIPNEDPTLYVNKTEALASWVSKKFDWESGTYAPGKLIGLNPETTEPIGGTKATSFTFALYTTYQISGKRKRTYTTEAYQGVIADPDYFAAVMDEEGFVFQQPQIWRITQQRGGAQLTLWIPRDVCDERAVIQFKAPDPLWELPTLDQNAIFGGSPPFWEEPTINLPPWGPDAPY